jgi:hypothetical protein
MARKTHPVNQAMEDAVAKQNAANKKDKPFRLISDGSWCTATIIDVTLSATQAGEPRMTLQMDVIAPRAYAGRTLYFGFQPSLDKTMDNLKENFPEVKNWFDQDHVWDTLGSEDVRVHVFIEPESTDPRTQQVYKAKNRVSSMWPKRK